MYNVEIAGLPGGGAVDFQDIILKLNQFWARQGCALLPAPPCSGEEAKALAAFPGALALSGQARQELGAGCFGLPQGRFPGFYRYHVIYKPPPADLRRLFLASLDRAGLDRVEHDLRWLEADCAAPQQGSSGTGWEVLLDGLELARFTYLNRLAGAELRAPCAAIVYGLERLALAAQRKKNIGDLAWAGRLTYGDLHPGAEGALQ